MRDALPELTGHGVAAVGISPDSPQQQKKFDDKHQLGFPLLSDTEHHIAEAYGVWGEKKMYGRTYMGIIRSHFVLDREGKIVDARVKVRPVDSVRLALEALGEAES